TSGSRADVRVQGCAPSRHRARLEEFGDSLRGSLSAARFDRSVIGLALKLFDDRPGDHFRRRAGEVHRPTGSIAIESVTDMEVLLKVMPQREIDEGPPVGGQLHGGREPTLDQGNVTDGQVPVELVDVGPDLETVLAR